ncbi:MAG: hypothetical protein K2P78_08230, partial [Gemmataceae bacterium]|nr:hypothetical protein [Gemmataceae bacterium]
PGVLPPTDPSVPPMMPDPNAPPQPQQDPFFQPQTGGGLAERTANQNFDGDFGGIFYQQFVNSVASGPTVVQQLVGYGPPKVVGSTQIVTIDPSTGGKVVTTVPLYGQGDPIYQSVVVPGGTAIDRQILRTSVAGRYQGVMITDNDNPRPMDRVYFGYNFYSRLGRSVDGQAANVDLQRQTVGFEKAFLNGNASFGMRLPFIQQYGSGLSTRVVGDLSLLGKYAFYNNRRTGDLVSAGFVLTTPTGGGGAILTDGTSVPHSWLFQPWAGFVKVYDRLYFQGITNVIAPSDRRDPTLLGNSLAAGYWVYRNPGDRLLTGIIPVAEVHVRNPLNHRNPNDPVFLQDQVNLTTGVHFRSNRGVLSPALSIPLVGPRPWAIEAMVYANWLF